MDMEVRKEGRRWMIESESMKYLCRTDTRGKGEGGRGKGGID